MTGHKYYVYVEYFELPGFTARKHFFWRSNMRSLPVYWRNVRVAEDGQAKEVPGVRLGFLPTLRSARRMRGSAKYKSENIEHPGAIWIWNYKARVIKNHLYNIHSRLLYSNHSYSDIKNITALALAGGANKFLKASGLPVQKNSTIRNRMALAGRLNKAYTKEHRQVYFPNKYK